MTEDFYMVAIVALLPLTACMLLTQSNPYYALIMRGIVGAVSALIYALFGAADVALTEAMVGTMLSVTLYAVAVRSSLIMRLGVLEQKSHSPSETPVPITLPEPLLTALQKTLSKKQVRLEIVAYPSPQALHTALAEKDVHTTCMLSSALVDEQPFYHLQTRIQRLYDLMQAELPSAIADLTYVNLASTHQPTDPPKAVIANVKEN